MTKQYWVKLWLILILSSFIILFLSIFYFSNNGRPLRFTNSLSYDAKLNFIRNNKLLDKADTLVIGSSMGLNNINGEILEKSDKIKFVLNASSWGLNTNEIFELLQALDLKKIKTVIYPQQYFDFEQFSSKNINKTEIKDFLSGKFIFKPYLETFQTLNNNLDTYIFWKSKALNEKKYDYLGFDKNGDINLDLEKKFINQKRWIKYSKNSVTDERNIKVLIKMNDYLKERNINFLVVTTPHRIEILNKDKQFQSFFSNFINRLEKLSKKYGFMYLNLHDKLMLNDSYFIDSSHLNIYGAKAVSSEIVNYLENKN